MLINKRPLLLNKDLAESIGLNEASYEYKIRNTIAYLKSCIVNAINEMRIDIDSELRTCGII